MKLTYMHTLSPFLGAATKMSRYAIAPPYKPSLRLFLRYRPCCGVVHLGILMSRSIIYLISIRRNDFICLSNMFLVKTNLSRGPPPTDRYPRRTFFGQEFDNIQITVCSSMHASCLSIRVTLVDFDFGLRQRTLTGRYLGWDMVYMLVQLWR